MLVVTDVVVKLPVPVTLSVVMVVGLNRLVAVTTNVVIVVVVNHPVRA